MRALIVGRAEFIEVIAEEFSISGTSERFIVHPAIDSCDKHGNERLAFVAAHLETSQIIGEGETIDAAIEEGTRRWMLATPDLIAAKLAERRAWVAERMKEREVEIA